MIPALLGQIPLPYRWAALAALTVAMVAGFFGYGAHRQSMGEAIGETTATCRYNEMITAQKLAAAQQLANEVAKKVAVETALHKFKSKQETEDAQKQKTVDNLTYRLRNLADAAGRLRDPNAKDAGCGGGGGGPLPGNTTTAVHSGGGGAETGGLLSADLSGLFRWEVEDADRTNLAYSACRAYLHQVRAIINKGE